MIITVLAAIATWLMPAGRYNKLSNKANDHFVLTTENGTMDIPFSQKTLDSLHILIGLEKFRNTAIGVGQVGAGEGAGVDRFGLGEVTPGQVGVAQVLAGQVDPGEGHTSRAAAEPDQVEDDRPFLGNVRVTDPGARAGQRVLVRRRCSHSGVIRKKQGHNLRLEY